MLFKMIPLIIKIMNWQFLYCIFLLGTNLGNQSWKTQNGDLYIVNVSQINSIYGKYGIISLSFRLELTIGLWLEGTNV